MGWPIGILTVLAIASGLGVLLPRGHRWPVLVPGCVPLAAAGLHWRSPEAYGEELVLLAVSVGAVLPIWCLGIGLGYRLRELRLDRAP